MHTAAALQAADAARGVCALRALVEVCYTIDYHAYISIPKYWALFESFLC
jgi:hypothetical protein